MYRVDEKSESLKAMDYLNINRTYWNSRVDAHYESEFYDVDAFLKGKEVLNDIELALLGDISGKSLLHLQCHFGQDTIALSRHGAHTTGIDFSEIAIDKAKALAKQCGETAAFVCCDVYKVPEVLSEPFDVVFTSFGTIGWLPDIHQWATVVVKMLKPGGMFVFADFHPVLWMMDDDFTYFKYSYFNLNTIEESNDGTYTGSRVTTRKTVSWNHSMSDVVGALLDAGLKLDKLQEFDYSPYPCFNHVVPHPKGYQIKGQEGILPMVYALRCAKPE